MGILRDFERRLEGAVEGLFARIFRSGLQPVELAKAVQRYAADYQQVGIDGVFVPNVYRFSLSAEDHERFTGIEGDLRHELADVVRSTAAERGWRLKGPVRIELRVDDGIRVGTYELRGKAEAGPSEPRRARAPEARNADRPGATSVLPQQAPPAAPPPAPPAGATLKVIGGARAKGEFRLDGRAVLGRLPDCDVTLEDPSVSRRHARVDRDGNRWTIEDLGSTNGVKINGSTVQRSSLADGDKIELGSVRLAFSAEG